MIDLKALLKVLYKPREAFGELKEEGVNWQEGMIMWFTFSVVSLIIFGAFSRALKDYTLDIVPLDFGFGAKFAAFEIAVFFVLAFVGFVISSWIANFAAQKIGGAGTFKETLAVFGYANVLALVKGITSAIILTWIAFNLVFLANAFLGNEMPSIEFLRTIGLATFVIGIVFIIWETIIKGFAVSAVHEIKPLKGICIAFISIMSVIILNFAGLYLIRYVGVSI